jgi:hypothetical protein
MKSVSLIPNSLGMIARVPRLRRDQKANYALHARATMTTDGPDTRIKTEAKIAAGSAFKQGEISPEVPEHERAQIAFRKNLERLRAERLVREAAAKEVPQVVRKTPRETSTRVRWTSSDDEKLLAMIAVGRSYEDVAVHLNRTVAATVQRANILKRQIKPRRPE